MKLRPFYFLALLSFSSLPWNVSATDVFSYRYNPRGQGVNASETRLSLDTVNPWDFGLQYSVPVTGQVYAQPLTKAHIGTPAKDLVFVVSQANVAMAVNIANGLPVWTTALTDFGDPVPSDDTLSTDITPQIGICSTPVILWDHLYLLSKAKRIDANLTPHYYYTIYKLDISNGKVVAKNNFADTAFNGSDYAYRTVGSQADPFVLGTGDGSISVNNEDRVYFNALREMNRAALTVAGGVIYAGFASHGDNGPYHGWVLGFDPASLRLVAVFNTTPNGGLGGIWQSGGGLATDSKNNLYFETGNGSFDGSQLTDGFPQDANYGDCFVKVARDSSTQAHPGKNGWGLKVVDYFTPSNNSDINDADLDLGSCGPLVVASGKKDFLIGLGKDGSLFSMDTGNMGKFDPNANHNLQTITNAVCIQGDTGDHWTAFCTPNFFNNRLYCIGGGDVGKQFTFNSDGTFGSWYLDGNSQVQTDVETDTSSPFQWPGANSTISARGGSDIILWALDQSASVLRAYRATDLLQIWNSGQVQADGFSGALKFSVPVVANGHVFVGTDGGLQIFGLSAADRHKGP